MRAPHAARLLVIAALTASCALTVRVDRDPGADLGSLRSWSWQEPPASPDANPFADNPLLRERVRSAVTRELGAQGRAEARDPSQADFAVTFHVVLEQRIYSDGGWYGGGVDPGWGWGHYRSYSLQEGTLVLDLLSPDGERLYWRGWVAGVVPTPDTDRSRVDEAVRAILERFAEDD